MADGQLTTAYGTAASTVRAALIAYLLGLWHTLPDQRDASAKRFIGLAAPAVAGAQLKVGQLTASYLSLLLAGQSGKAAAPISVRPADVANLRGVTPATLYQRPFTRVYTELSKGQPYETAVQRGRARLVDIASTDVQLAKTHTAKRVIAAEPRVTGYRRVLTGSESCGLCVITSTQVYHREELLPIHPGCDCGVDPVIGDEKPTQVLDRALLDAAHAAIAERFGKFDAGGRAPDYRKVILVRQHGEIGPLLTVKDQEFTGPDDLSGSGS